MNPDPDKAYDEMIEDQALMYLENEPTCRECGELLTSPNAQCKWCGSQGGGTD
jgi:uncharacterized OB-fold protein